ncbi:uncharacterized protein PgNI_02487 [Pyricularia grisea]|uniref:Uncharacterized protein n=1 Tax=Pyricularia grisea TaxID=148305 RepID=A0A6P8BK46_PYRGI|nr:uncharacterized protein PgNI_02487 [Pyricularia grisea]TLD17168.1 hypothetical protein PgNI_02487 [Pyricularia grisea]
MNLNSACGIVIRPGTRPRSIDRASVIDIGERLWRLIESLW